MAREAELLQCSVCMAPGKAKAQSKVTMDGNEGVGARRYRARACRSPAALQLARADVLPPARDRPAYSRSTNGSVSRHAFQPE